MDQDRRRQRRHTQKKQWRQKRHKLQMSRKTQIYLCFIRCPTYPRDAKETQTAQNPAAASSSTLHNPHGSPPRNGASPPHVAACVRDNRSSPRPATPASAPASPHPPTTTPHP